MSAVKSEHFRVGNGDMVLLTFESGRRVLIDINVRVPDDEIVDVAKQLRNRLDRDDKGRLFVDAFLSTHPDQDHIRGLREHFHLGPLTDWSKSADKILIREMWSSPIVFRRAHKKNHLLCEDADAWCAEARRRVRVFESGGTVVDGDRIKILGEDENGKTDKLGAILVKTGQTFSSICGASDSSFAAHLLAPMVADDETEEEIITKNNSSVIMRIDLKVRAMTQGRFLFGGDADVGVWERIWERNGATVVNIQYDVLIAPHHCSWHSLSWDSWSEMGEDANVSPDARSALAQARSGALIIASSKPVTDDDSDPPCIRAKREYEEILELQSGEFHCVADRSGEEPLVIEVLAQGPKIKRAVFAATVAAGTGIGSQPFAHGKK
jgi:beta-lactamase superfamily II metal-dependent hydrolase